MPVGSPIRELLFTDFDGKPVEDPDDVITDAFDDPRYTARIEPLRAVLGDESADPYDRFLACCALASWAERDGYAAVAAAAAQSDQVVWHGALTDHRYSVDETFAHLAGTMYLSEDLTEAKGTEADRLAALRALLAIADEQYFDWRLAFALNAKSLPPVLDLLPEVVRRGIRRLTDGPRPSFDLGTQLADLIAAATVVDESLAVELGMELARVDASVRTTTHLAAVVARGRTQVSATFAEYLKSVGDAGAREAVDEAISER
ncbi:hypothetical protein [Amycolatopsis magusensis]|uniref:hypothetical protein n=1 Tax=Amycolatopsis magusensis TaxID=882444 RepID=UPI0037A51264